MKLFISYCHKNEKDVDRLIKQLSPLRGEGKLISDIWYDRNITVGDNFWERIDEHLENRDVICMLISADYIASKSCKEELLRTLKRHQEEGVLAIPIILSPCPWLDVDESLSKILATPTDGQAISEFSDEDKAWMDVYNQIKKALEFYKKIKKIKFSTEHSNFLNNATNFAKSNPNKNILLLDDIFVYPDLCKLEIEGELNRLSSKKLIDDYSIGNKFVIVGDDLSGKTSLLKMYIKDLRNKGFYPIYIKDPMELLQGNFMNRIYNEFGEQYESEVEFSNLSKDKIIVIVDDFHKCKNKKKILKQILEFKGCIIVVDDVYAIDVQNDILADFDKYEIKQLKASQRNELIQKWLLASEFPIEQRVLTNDELRKIDEASALIEESLGRVLGKGIMPSYAYFILTLLVINEDNERPLDEKITSQGYCYQALIILFLKKHGVSNQNMDSYINFLSEFAMEIYKNHNQPLTSIQFEEFTANYETKFYLTEQMNTMLEKLEASNIMSKTSFGNYQFNYPYIYYFFAGKYLAQAWEDKEEAYHEEALEQINLILDNLHKTSNAYIAVFIAHHTKNTALIQKILNVAHDLFAKYQPATMDKKSLSIFSDVERNFNPPALSIVNTPSENRAKELKVKDIEEVEKDECIDDVEFEEEENPFTLELRRSIKTVEVIGSIIKNRAGSLRSNQVEKLFEEAMNINLRNVTNFLDLVKSIVESEEGLRFLEEKIREMHPSMDERELSSRAKMLFWSMNFIFLFSVIKKTAFSLGSAATAKIAKVVCERINTPASFLLKHTILMWFKKNIDINELQKMDRILDNLTVKNTMLYLLSDYCRVHIINYKDAAKLESLGIKRQVFLPSPDKEKL